MSAWQRPTDFDLTPHLETLEAMIEMERVLAAEERQRASLLHKPLDRPPVIITQQNDCQPTNQSLSLPDWPAISYRQAFRSPQHLLVHELQQVYEGLLLGDDRIYSVGVNFGAAIGPSMFGCEIVQFKDDLPQVIPLEVDDVGLALIRGGVPDLNAGLGVRVWETLDQWQAWLAPYPRLSQAIHLEMPEVLGPFELAGHIIGKDIFTWVVDDPELLHDVLQVMTDTCIAIASRFRAQTAAPANIHYRHGCRIPASAHIQDTLAGQMTGQMYRRFAARYNAQISAALGNVSIAFCVPNERVFRQLSATSGVTVIQCGEDIGPHFDTCLQAARERTNGLIWSWTTQRSLPEVTTGVIHKVIAPDWPTARRLAGQPGE
ncbi:MAG: hypothetical protein GYB65_12405 [Chloroflexi bacterium]|nr:hypothetical protein [Chloroflexota bacterium]